MICTCADTFPFMFPQLLERAVEVAHASGDDTARRALSLLRDQVGAVTGRQGRVAVHRQGEASCLCWAH